MFKVNNTPKILGVKYTESSLDCKTDVYFNTISLLFPLIGKRFHIWYLDPLGAALLSVYVVYDWANTSLSTIIRLTGTTVSSQMDKKLMYLAWRFSPIIDAYKSMTAYHIGDGVVVEVEITLDESTSLPRAHDISQTMQYCFEGIQPCYMPTGTFADLYERIG